MSNTDLRAGFRRILAPAQPNGRKDRDGDLLLFRELHKLERERMVGLLLPVSDEFEPNGGFQHSGNYSLYRVPSAKRGSGYEFLGENEKNDYDWLKTPPATPLFPSLEMESTAPPELVVHRELPIIQTLSRFSGNSEESKASNGRPKTPNSTLTTDGPKEPTQVPSNGRPKTTNSTLPNVTPKEPNLVVSNIKPKTPNPKPKVHQRSVTPSQKRPSISSNTKPSPFLNQRTTPLITDLTKRINMITTTAKSNINQRENKMDLVNSNISKDIVATEPKTKPRSRGVSPLVRSTIPAQIAEFSNETPPNLRTDRSTSPSRDRPGYPTIANKHKPAPAFPNPTVNLRTDRSTSASRDRPVIKPTERSTSASRNRTGNLNIQNQQTPEAIINPRRQSCSPSVIRGRKLDDNDGNLSNQKGRTTQTANGTQVFGSKMVDKFMNARKVGGDDKDTRRNRSSNNEASGFGRTISKSSLDTAIKNMEIKQDRTCVEKNLRSPGVAR